MRFRLRVVAMTLFALAAVAVLWPWHRTYEGRRVLCGPAIFVVFPNDPGDLRGAERRAYDRCKSFDVGLVAVGVVLSLAGGYARAWPRGDRHLPSTPMPPPGAPTEG